MSAYTMFKDTTFTEDAERAAAATGSTTSKRKKEESLSEPSAKKHHKEETKAPRDITGDETECDEEEDEGHEQKPTSTTEAAISDDGLHIRQCAAYTLLESFARRVVSQMKIHRCNLAKATAIVVKSMDV